MNRRQILLASLFSVLPSALYAQAFTPKQDGTIAVSASTSNTNGTLSAPPTSSAPSQFRVFNACAVTAFIRFGGSATTSNLPVPSGAVEVLSAPAGTTTVGVILASGSGCSVYFTTGAGL